MTALWSHTKADSSRFMKARRGDSLMTPFECDLCVFRKLRKREPDATKPIDVYLQAGIRRILLDALWSKETTTVSGTASKIAEGLRISTSLDLTGPYPEPGPLPAYDHCGYEVALQVVMSSLGEGRYNSTYKQWDTVRRLRSAASSQYRTSRLANELCVASADDSGKQVARLTQDPCHSRFYQCFSTGCKKRMGQDWRPNKAISVDLMRAVLEDFLTLATSEKGTRSRSLWIFGGAYCAICFVVSLRGSEGLMVDLGGLCSHFNDCPEKYSVVSLRGRVKGENHERSHLLPCSNETDSGIQVRKWIKWTIIMNSRLRRRDGPAFVKSKGSEFLPMQSKDMNKMFVDCLMRVFDKSPELFPRDILDAEKIEEKYNVFRSFRRGSSSRAIAKKIAQSDLEVVNRWKKKEKAGANRPAFSMHEHYADVDLLRPAFLRYSKAM
jgi:hypothetical protein